MPVFSHFPEPPCSFLWGQGYLGKVKTCLVHRVIVVCHLHLALSSHWVKLGRRVCFERELVEAVRLCVYSFCLTVRAVYSEVAHCAGCWLSHNKSLSLNQKCTGLGWVHTATQTSLSVRIALSQSGCTISFAFLFSPEPTFHLGLYFVLFSISMPGGS